MLGLESNPPVLEVNWWPGAFSVVDSEEPSSIRIKYIGRSSLGATWQTLLYTALANYTASQSIHISYAYHIKAGIVFIPLV